MPDSKIRVLLVDDSSMVRELLREILEQEPDMLVAGVAQNGREAIEMTRLLKPDIVTMDLEMPVMNGMEAITSIMGAKAVPILVVSGQTDAQKAYEAVRRGALDVVARPNVSKASVREFVAKVRMLAKVPVITHIRPLYVDPPHPAEAALPHRPPLASLKADTSVNGPAGPVFAMASSTGGPQVLARILPKLPADFPCPVLIAQHISEGFASGMAEWLSGLCRLPVRLARHGEAVCPGVIALAPPEYHTIVNSSRQIQFVERGEHDLYRPSCDHLLESVATVYGTSAIGIILTGMGKDGAGGIGAILRNGGVTIAQNCETSLIYGMNRCAIEAGAVQHVLPESDIAEEIIRLARGRM